VRFPTYKSLQLPSPCRVVGGRSTRLVSGKLSRPHSVRLASFSRSVLLRSLSDGAVVFRSETAQQTPNPSWRPLAAVPDTAPAPDSPHASARQVTVRVFCTRPASDAVCFTPLPLGGSPAGSAAGTTSSQFPSATCEVLSFFDVSVDLGALAPCQPGWVVLPLPPAAPVVGGSGGMGGGIAPAPMPVPSLATAGSLASSRALVPSGTLAPGAGVALLFP
jgi:hypothetical protein